MRIARVGRRLALASAVIAALFSAGVLAAAVSPATGPGSGTRLQRSDPNHEDWIQLFNGRDLDGWSVKFAKHDLGENLNETVRAGEGLLKVRFDRWSTFNGEFGHIFYKNPFSYYRLVAEYRFVGSQVSGGPGWAMRNNGLMLLNLEGCTDPKASNYKTYYVKSNPGACRY